MLAFAKNRSYAKQYFGTLSRIRVLPGLEGVVCGQHCALRKFLCRFLKATNHLCTLCGVKAVKLAFGRDALAANHQRILAAQLALDLLDRGPHSDGIFFSA